MWATVMKQVTGYYLDRYLAEIVGCWQTKIRSDKMANSKSYARFILVCVTNAIKRELWSGPGYAK